MKTPVHARFNRRGKLKINWLIGLLISIGGAALFLDGAFRKSLVANNFTPPTAVGVDSQLRFLERIHQLELHKLADVQRRETAAKLPIERVFASIDASDAEKRLANFYQLSFYANVMALLPDEQVSRAAVDGNKQFDKYFSSDAPFTFEDYSLAIKWVMTLKSSRCVEETKWICSRLIIAFQNQPNSKLATTRSELFESIAKQLDWIGRKVDLKSKQLGGEPFEMGNLRGKWVLVRFWSVSCVPCRAECNKLKAVYAQYRKASFEIIGVCMTPSRSLMTSSPSYEKSDWIELWDNESDANHNLVQQFGVVAVPTSFLVSPERVIVAIDVRADVPTGPGSLSERLAEVLH